MRAIPLTDQSDGINLLRSKGGASPTGLFDLVNGWVTPKRTINARPGCVRELIFPAGTKGVVGFEGKYHTFAASPSIVSTDSRVVVHALRRSDGSSAALARVHRAFPFLGRLYVVAEFTDGVVRHFWIEDAPVWTPNTVYKYGAKIRSTTDVGLAFVIEATDPAPAWQANTTVTVGDFKQPTTTNSFKYELTGALLPSGAVARTSETEPTWPTTDGATVTERRYITALSRLPGSGVPTSGTGATSPAGSEYGTSSAGRTSTDRSGL